MIMKHFTAYTVLVMLLGSMLQACDAEYKTYSDAEYVLFSDTLSVNMVWQGQEFFTVPVVSTVTCGYDRTFGVEVIGRGSNAVEGRHYRLRTNSITIPAGQRRADVEVEGIYDNIGPTDSLGFILSLVMPEALEWNLYPEHTRTKVTMRKSCPFDIHGFEGWCVLTSTLLLEYPGRNTSYQRLVRSEVHPTEENAIIVHDALYDGYGIVLRFEPDDPANPLVCMDADQQLSDEVSVFGQINGDNRILAEGSRQQPSTFSSCERFVSLWMRVYVNDMDTPVGTVGYYFSVLEWVSDEEADRLRREEGM